MQHRADREDLTSQREALAVARGDLATALDAVEFQARAAARLARSKAKRPPRVDLTHYLAAHQDVVRAEEAVDLAAYDLRTASGEDG